MLITLLSMEGQRALGSHQKYLNVFRKSYGLERHKGGVIIDRILNNKNFII